MHLLLRCFVGAGLLLFASGLAGKPQTSSGSESDIVALVERIAASAEADREAAIDAAAAESWQAMLKLAHDRAEAAFDKQNYRGALPLYRIAGGLAHRLKNHLEEVKMIAQTGSTLFKLGEPKQALEEYEKGLSLVAEGDLPAEQANLLTARGITLLELGRLSEAMASNKQSQELFRQLGDQVGIARTTNNLGNVYLATGDYRAAAEQYQQCLQLSEAIGQKRGIGFSLNNLGNLYYAQGDIERALEYHQRSLAVKKTLGNKHDIATAYLNIGLEEYELGKLDLALKTTEQSLTISREIGNKQMVAYSLNNRSLVERDAGQLKEARRDLEESLAISRENDRLSSAALSLENISVIALKEGNAAEALEKSREAVQMAQTIGSDNVLRQAAVAMGKALLALDKRQEAREAFLLAVGAIESQQARLAGGEAEAARFVGDKTLPYQAVVSLMLEGRDTFGAFRMAERAKSRVLLDALRNGRVEITKAMTPGEQQRERALSVRVSGLSREVTAQGGRTPAALKARWEAARKELDLFRDELYAVHPSLRGQRGESAPITLGQMGRLLPNSQTALLEYAQMPEGLALFVVTKSAATPSIAVHMIRTKPAELSALIKRFEDRISSRDLGYRDDAARLYQILLGPAQAELKGKSTLVIVPDGPLWHLPFQALISPRGTHVLEEQAVFYAPSLTVLWESVNGRRPADSHSLSLLAMGNPPAESASGKGASRGMVMSELPDAEREVQALGVLYGKEQSRVYTGAEAREDRLKTEAPHFRLLHLATHGVLNDANPLYSYILLARGKDGGEDGLLDAREMMGLDLTAQLVLLSACETAGGKLSGGEGLVGMSWALQVAGSPAVLVSQWKVDSASTADLMLEFHRQLRPRLRAGPLLTGKAAALREASLTLMKDPRYRHPFYWSPFVLIGDGY